jgi:hypothetical protein
LENRSRTPRAIALVTRLKGSTLLTPARRICCRSART